MRRLGYFILAACLLQVACSDPPTDISGFQVILLRNITAQNCGMDIQVVSDKSVRVRLVEKRAGKLVETRYTSSLTDAEHTALIRAINSADFFNLKSSNGDAAIPGEPHPVIFIKTEASDSITWRWDSERDEKFNAVYLLLLEIAESAKTGEKRYHGPYNPLSDLDR